MAHDIALTMILLVLDDAQIFQSAGETPGDLGCIVWRAVHHDDEFIFIRLIGEIFDALFQIITDPLPFFVGRNDDRKIWLRFHMSAD